MRAAAISIHDTNVRRRIDTKPWYRQFWPWFLIALPGVSAAVSGGMLYAALHGGDVVVPHEGDSTSYSAPQAPTGLRTEQAKP